MSRSSSNNNSNNNINNNNTSWVLDEEEAQQHPSNDSNPNNPPEAQQQELSVNHNPPNQNQLHDWTREYDAEWQVQELERRSRHCQERCLSIWFGLDLLVFGVAWTVYAGLLVCYNTNYFESTSTTHPQITHDPSARIFLAVATLLAVLLCFRSICGLCALRCWEAPQQQQQRTACCCWRGVIMPISIVLTLLYFVATVMLLLVSWIEPHSVEHFISRHAQQPHDGSATSSSWLFPNVIAQWILQKDQQHAAATLHYLCILGLLLSIVEWTKGQLASYYHYHHCIRVVSNSSSSTSPPPIHSVSYNNYHNHNVTNASWWSGTMSAIGEEDDYGSATLWHEPLLSEGRRHRRRGHLRRQRTLWWHNFFIRRPQREQDDPSVASSSSSETGLFASVQDEWATRSQEAGPLWWASREEEKHDGHHQQEQRPTETDPKVPANQQHPSQPSWVQNNDQ